MAEYTALIEQLCAKRSTLVQAMAANPEQITDEQIRDLAWLQSAFLAVEAAWCTDQGCGRTDPNHGPDYAMRT